MLAEAVRRFGTRWREISTLPGLDHHSPVALRLRWSRLCRRVRGDSKPYSVSAPASFAAPHVPLPSSLPVVPVPAHVLPLPRLALEFVPRGLSYRRSWTYALSQRVPSPPAAGLTDRRASLVSLWRLDECAHPHSLLLCNLARAEERVRDHFRKAGVADSALNAHVLSTAFSVQERDLLGLVWYPTDRCGTLVSSNSHLIYIGGPGACPGRLASPSDVAGFMGISARCASFKVASACGITPIQLCQCISESVQPFVARCVVDLALSVCSAEVTNVGSVYSGLFDQLGSAFHRCLSRFSLVYVAESHPRKREALRYAFSPLCVYADAAAATKHPSRVHALCFSPPCIYVSSARRVRDRPDAVSRDLHADALSSTSEWLDVLESCTSTQDPYLIVIELTDFAKYSDCLALVHQRLTALPYVVLYGLVDAAAAAEVSFPRSRSFWICVRHDLYCGSPF
jgi:hypothetical protein